MRKQLGNTNIIFGSIIFSLCIAGGYIFKEWLIQKDRIAALEGLNEIKALDGILKDAATFEFASIKTTFVIHLDKTYDRPEGGVGVLNDKVSSIYTTDYTFTFGYDLENWNWCSKVINKAEGIVEVNAPKIVWTNANVEIVPDLWIPIDGIFYTALEPDVQKDVKSITTKKISDKANAYLSDAKMQLSIERSLSNFLQKTMNEAHDGNPISEVRIRHDENCV